MSSIAVGDGWKTLNSTEKKASSSRRCQAGLARPGGRAAAACLRPLPHFLLFSIQNIIKNLYVSMH